MVEKPNGKDIVVLDHFKFLWDGTSDKYRYVVLQGGAGSGKALTKDTKIVTPYGYKTMEEIQVGDTVCTVDGSVTKVIHKWHPETHKVYRLTFADGRTCDAGEEHLWKYCIDNKVYKSGKIWKIGTTADLKKMMEEKKYNARRKHLYVPVTDPVYFLPKGKQTIPPYLLGLLIGDGCFTAKSNIQYITADEELKEYVESQGFKAHLYTKNRNTPVYQFNIESLRKDIDRLGLNGKLATDKHIPESYMFTTIENRWEILRGLMDTDGTCSKNGIPEYSTASKQLAEDVAWIVRSLGGYCTITSKIGAYTKDGERIKTIPQYRLYIRMKTSEPIFKLQRKQDRVMKYNGGKSELKLMITSIEEIDYKDDIYCIAVEDESSLFMANDFIVTHNSKSICQRIVYLFLNYADLNIYVVRATMPALTRSVFLGQDPSIVSELGIWGIPAYDWLNKSEKCIINPNNGSRITFIGLDDPEKIKSINANYIWIEEATELSTDKFNQLNLRLRRDNPVEGKINQMFISYNPISYNNWVITTFQTNVAPDREPMIYRSFSNFAQNKFVSMDSVKEWLITARNSRQFYLTYILGIPGIPMGQIYPNVSYLPQDEWNNHVWECTPYYGIDWGYIDPIVLVECRDVIDDKGEMTVYVRCLYYETNKFTNNLIDRMRELGISKSSLIYCDYAEQDRKAEVVKAGYSCCLNARKNINAGISHLQGCNIVCDNSREYGKKIELEFTGYTWQKDPDDPEKYLDKPIEEDNDAMDAIRYAIFSHHMNSVYVSVSSISLDPIKALNDKYSFKV